MDEEALDYFTIRRASNAQFYVTRQEQAFCTRGGDLMYFETERQALEFLAEIGDIAPN